MYKLTQRGAILRLSDDACIPADPQNIDYLTYLDWVNVGNTPDPADVPALSSVLAQAMVDIRTVRAPVLDALSGIAGRAQRAGDNTTAQAADTAAQALLDITQLPALLNATSYDDMKAVVLQRYREIAAAAPTSVQAPFLEMLAS